jgi:hypothetical protein
LILTTESSLSEVHSPSMLKLCLGDYADIYMNKITPPDVEKEAESIHSKKGDGNLVKMEGSVKEWE